MNLRDVARNALYCFFHRLAGPRRGVRVILLYHSVSCEPVAHPYSISLAVFLHQMEFISSHFKTVRLCDLAKAMETEMPETNLACVTFDDGCLDNYEVALPVLERFGIKATFFIVTGLVGEWLQASKTTVRLMGREHIQRLHVSGHEIGAHTVNHTKLTEVPLEIARAEIQRSKKFLEDLLGSEVVSFAYPKGKHDEAVKAEVSEAGFRWAVTVREGLVPDQPDWLALPRVWGSECLSLAAFAAKVFTGYRWCEQLRRWVR